MNMLKFVISNRVGMAFNWVGSAPKSPDQPKKHAFKETLTYKALNGKIHRSLAKTASVYYLGLRCLKLLKNLVLFNSH